MTVSESPGTREGSTRGRSARKGDRLLPCVRRCRSSRSGAPSRDKLSTLGADGLAEGVVIGAKDHGSGDRRLADDDTGLYALDNTALLIRA